MRRFFVAPECINGDTVTLSGDVSYRLSRVLRSRRGDRIIVLDGSVSECHVTLESVRPEEVVGVITRRVPTTADPAVWITIYQGVLKADKFELVLQKGTELGVSAFVPMSCYRSVPRESKAAVNRSVRWRKIMTEAAEQSRRGRIPDLKDLVDFQGACDHVDGFAIIPSERETNTGLKSALSQARRPDGSLSKISIFIGPEGGFTPEEVEYARERDVIPVTLGRRVLRAETAGLVTASAILYDMGELGG
jgi:16S rRNA (uracil1498-N3)-methyltransferase